VEEPGALLSGIDLQQASHQRKRYRAGVVRRSVWVHKAYSAIRPYGNLVLRKMNHSNGTVLGLSRDFDG
jgi:hypothetical protein